MLLYRRVYTHVNRSGVKSMPTGGSERTRATPPLAYISQMTKPPAHFSWRTEVMSILQNASNTTAPTQFLEASDETYAYRRFGSGPGRPLLCLQHFTGTLDNWDPAVTGPLASGREVILFESAGLGRSTGAVPGRIDGMAKHAFAFLDGLGLASCDVLGFSLGGMVAQQMAQDRPSIFRRMILVGTAPRGGDDIMHLEKPSLAKYLADPNLQGYEVLQKIFFAPTDEPKGWIAAATEAATTTNPGIDRLARPSWGFCGAA